VAYFLARAGPHNGQVTFPPHWKIGIQTRTDTAAFTLLVPSPYLTCAAHNQFQSSPPLLSLSLPPLCRSPSPAATTCCSASALAQTMFDLASGVVVSIPQHQSNGTRLDVHCLLLLVLPCCSAEGGVPGCLDGEACSAHRPQPRHFYARYRHVCGRGGLCLSQGGATKESGVAGRPVGDVDGRGRLPVVGDDRVGRERVP
jgi:hypothetical protein